jgi:hypothetical protein
MVYLGDNWPDQYRDSIFMGNIHGYRINQDSLERQGSGYISKRAPDFFFANDNWFRGLELKYGPDGGVYITDWCDTGECHDYKGVHRTSGRVYKVVYGEPKKTAPMDLSKLSDGELVELQLHKNDYFCRQARLLLASRAAKGKLDAQAVDRLRKMFLNEAETTRKLRALWCLHATGNLQAKFLALQARHEDEHIRAWSVRLLREYEGGLETRVTLLTELADEDKSPLVRLEVASALQRLPIADRWEIANFLVAHEEDAEDDNLPLMIWYGIEAAIPTDKAKAARVLAQSKLPTVRQFIARRLAATATTPEGK